MLTTDSAVYLFDVIAVEQNSSLHRIIEPEQQPTDSLLMTLTMVENSKDMCSIVWACRSDTL
jgi:virulence-associated protein VagC